VCVFMYVGGGGPWGWISDFCLSVLINPMQSVDITNHQPTYPKPNTHTQHQSKQQVTKDIETKRASASESGLVRELVDEQNIAEVGVYLGSRVYVFLWGVCMCMWLMVRDRGT
jgi:hypothetical protein